MEKNNRLNIIESLIDKNTDVLLDIGTDHGYLIKKAFQNNKINSALATDINIKPLESAKKNLEGYNVDFILSDGFSNVSKKFDCVVIAGMGANLINSILALDPGYENTIYILQANNKVERLRKYLLDNNYKIIDEVIVLDNKYYYVIIKAIKGMMVLTEEEIYLGPILMKRSESIAYYQNKLDNYNYLINKKKAHREPFSKQISYLNNIIDKLTK